MEVKILEPEQWLREIEIQVEPQRVQKKITELIETYAKRIKIPGFRKGRAPLTVVEKRYGKELETVALKQLFDETTKETIEAKQLKPLTQPTITDYNLDENRKLTFKIAFEIIPDFTLKEYKNLRLKKLEPTGFDEEFEQRLQQLLDRCATYIPLNRPAEKGDFILCDYETYEDGKLVSKPAQNVLIPINDTMNLKEINQGLLGAKPGEVREITITFPQNHQDRTLAGKTYTYKFTIRACKEKRLPELNETFAQDLGFKDLDALRQQLNEEILTDRARLVETDLLNQIYNQLVAEYDFEPPASLVTDAYNNIIQANGLEDTAETREKLLPIAKRQAKFKIIISRIAQQENITPTKEEIEVKIQQYAAQGELKPETLAKLPENPLFLYEIIKEKTMDFLLRNAKIE